ncbi:MAG: hypothetical protein GY824_01415, partial [Delftia sp.]|nr:hypothetical protein [Delftia sp.]
MTLHTNGDLLSIDLAALIEQVVDQVYGSDERDLLRQWLARNTSSQIVELNLRLALASNSDARLA